jgi:uncharacterized protein (TIGR02117 family)
MMSMPCDRTTEAAATPAAVSRFWLARLRRWLRPVGYAASLFVLAIVLYVGAGFALAWIPVNTDFRPDPTGVEIAVMHNGVHTDLVLPLRNSQHDWWELLSPDDFPCNGSGFHYVAFGWGGREFYLETPTWADVRVTTVVKAAIGIGSTTVHAELRHELPPTSATCRRIWVNSEQYARLVQGVRNTLALADDGRARPIRGAHYYSTDAFYEATGRYHLFRTCNVWTGNILRNAGIRVGIWTPFTSSVFAQLPSEAPVT